MGSIEHTRPLEDSGSETLARYVFQTLLTTLTCLEMLRDPDILEVVCEWHEDFVIVRQNSIELVSVKHLEPSQGAWSLATIVGDGGLRHLFDRWRASDERAQCKLMTNAGLKTGRSEAAALQSCHDAAIRRHCAELIAPKVGATDCSVAERFLAALKVIAELPKRDDLRAQIMHTHLPELASAAGWTAEEARDYFAAIESTVFQAAASDVRAESRSLSCLFPQSTAEARARARKTVDRDAIARCLAETREKSTSVLVQKLEQGGLRPNDVEHCKATRLRWLSHSLRWDLDLPELPGHALADLRYELLGLARDAQNAQEHGAAPYAVAMRTDLEGRIADADLPGRYRLSLEQLLGLAYEMTDQCHIWWSERFEPTVGTS